MLSKTKVYSRFPCLLAKEAHRQAVGCSILYEDGSALSELEVYPFFRAGVAKAQYPVVVKGPRVGVGFTPRHDAFYAVEPGSKVNAFQQGLAYYLFVARLAALEFRQARFRGFPVFDGAADGDVFVAFFPILRYGRLKAFNSFGQKQKPQVAPFPDHVPAVISPFVRVLNKEVRGKAEVHQGTWGYGILPVFFPAHRRVEFLRLYDQVCVYAPLRVAFVNVTVRTPVAMPVTPAPGIPDGGFHGM